MNTKELLYWITEREKVRLAREAGEPKPWSKDPIFQTTRFCNVERERDKVTMWIAKNWRTPHKNNPDLWFGMVMARLLNNPDSLEAVGFPTSWNPKRFAHVLHMRKKCGELVFNGAYIVSTNGMAMDKVDYLVEYVLNPLWKYRYELRPERGATLAQYHNTLTDYNGLGSFMAAQVIADLKYVAPLNHAKDWWTWAAPGPGSMRGLNLVMGRDVNAPWRPAEWLDALHELQEEVKVPFEKLRLPRLHAQDLQNCLCEYSKYWRIKHNNGRAKTKFNGTA